MNVMKQLRTRNISPVSDISAVITPNLPDMKKRAPVSDLDHVYSQLQQSMMMGEFVPGQKLKLGELAAAFGTSHMPVREALNQLAVTQTIETAPRRTPSVPKADIKRLHDILSLRVDLETKAARLAIEFNDGSLEKALRAINSKMDTEAAKRKPSMRTYLSLNQRFHFEIYRRSNNADLLNFIELLWMRYGPLLNLISTGDGLSFGHSQHINMIEAVGAQDSTNLEAAITQDLMSAAKAIEAKITA